MESIKTIFTRVAEATKDLRKNYFAGISSLSLIKNLKNHFKMAGGCLAMGTAGVTAASALGFNIAAGLTAGAALATGPLAAGVALGGLLGGGVIALDGLDSILSEGRKAREMQDSASRTLLNENIGRHPAHSNHNNNQSGHHHNHHSGEDPLDLDLALEAA